jgi:hypothetical protein
MIPGSAEVCSALFIDFDNVYLSLRRENEEAAGRFARNPAAWMNRIKTGGLVRYKTHDDYVRRRFAIAKCYGNPGRKFISRGGPHDPHNFATVSGTLMSAGLEIVNCEPFSSQFKNGSDIRMACEIRDALEHATRFGEFIILSGDADFTPVLHNLRSHDRRTVVYANEGTAEIYKAFADGWIEEQDMISFLLKETLPVLLSHDKGAKRGQLGYDGAWTSPQGIAPPTVAQAARPPFPDFGGHGSANESARRRLPGIPAVQSLVNDFQEIGSEILNLVIEVVRSSDTPVPIAFLADRAQKILGHAKTVGTNWAGAGGFLAFLTAELPDGIRLTDRPPHFVYDPKRHRVEEPEEPSPIFTIPPKPQSLHRPPAQDTNSTKIAELQNSIARIYEACKAPPLPPSEYQLLFTLIATEVHERGFVPGKTAEAVVARARQKNLGIAMSDVSFVLNAVDEIDPWLEHTRSPATVSQAYRNFVLERCKHAGVELTEDEFQLVQVWFGASPLSPVRPNGLGGASPLTAEPPRRETRSYLSESALPPLDQRNDIPLPPDFGFDQDLDAEPNPKPVSKRFGFKR